MGGRSRPEQFRFLMTRPRRSEEPSSTVRMSRRSWSRVGEVMADPTVVEVLRVEEPATGEGRRHVVVRWSDGSTGRALSYFADEMLVSEGDMGTRGLCPLELSRTVFLGRSTRGGPIIGTRACRAMQAAQRYRRDARGGARGLCAVVGRESSATAPPRAPGERDVSRPPPVAGAPRPQRASQRWSSTRSLARGNRSCADGAKRR